MFRLFFGAIKYVSWRKTGYFLRCAADYILMMAGFEPRFARRPVFMSVEPANVCNLRCPQCALGSGMIRPEARLMPMELFERIIDEAGGSLLSLTFFFQGEPLMNSNLPRMIELAHQKGIYTLCSTNAQLLDAGMAESLVKSGLDRLVVSMDGHTQQSYGKYRVGGEVNKVYEALRHLADAKRNAASRTPVVELQCLYLSSTEGSIDYFRKNYRVLGADIMSFKTAQFYDFEHGNELMPADESRSRYKRTADGSYVLKGRLARHCFRIVSGCVVDAWGVVRPCCFDKNPDYAYGSLRESSLTELWNGARAKKFRNAVMRHRETIDICRNCTNT